VTAAISVLEQLLRIAVVEEKANRITGSPASVLAVASYETGNASMPSVNTNQDRQSAPTIEQLRRDIDRGMAADKVRLTDPAAAPLGTDDEAAGTPATPSRIARAVLTEISPPNVSDDDPAPGAAWIIIAAVFVLIAAIVLAWQFAR
jgi:hypothetical protein